MLSPRNQIHYFTDIFFNTQCLSPPLRTATLRTPIFYCKKKVYGERQYAEGLMFAFSISMRKYNIFIVHMNVVSVARVIRGELNWLEHQLILIVVTTKILNII